MICLLLQFVTLNPQQTFHVPRMLFAYRGNYTLMVSTLAHVPGNIQTWHVTGGDDPLPYGNT